MSNKNISEIGSGVNFNESDCQYKKVSRKMLRCRHIACYKRIDKKNNEGVTCIVERPSGLEIMII